MRSFALAIILSSGFLAMALRAIRSGRLREHSALLWLGVSAVMVFLSATLPAHLIDHLSHLVGIAYPPDMLLLLAVLFLVVLVFHLSLSITNLKDKQTRLVQEIGLLRASLASDQARNARADHQLVGSASGRGHDSTTDPPRGD